MAANRIAIAFTLGVFLLNLLLGSWEAPATGDGYEEIRRLREEGAPRPQHLLLTEAWRALHRAALALEPGTPPLRTLVIVNAASGAAALGLALRMGIALGVGVRAMAVAAAALAVSWAWWLHSRDPESAMLAEALLVASAFLLVRGRVLRNRARALCAMLFTLACAMAANVLTMLPMLVLLERWRSGRRWHHPRTLLFAAALVLPFFAVAWWQYGSHRQEIGVPFRAWLTHHSSESTMGAIERGPTIAAMLRAASGLLRCFLPLEGGVPAAIKLQLTGRELAEISATSMATFCVAAAATLLLVLLFARAVLRAPWNRAAYQAFTAGFAGTALGCWIWLGSDPQFWLPMLPFLFVGAAAGWKSLEAFPSRMVAWSAAATFACLFILNARWPTPSMVDREGGPAWRAAGKFCEAVQPGDLLVAKDSPWLFHVRERCEGVHSYPLLYGSHSGHALLLDLQSSIDSALVSGSRVLVEDFCSTPHLVDLGFWENMAVAKGISREELCVQLADRYRLEPLSMKDEPPLLHLTLR